MSEDLALYEDGLQPVILITGQPGAGKTLFAVSKFLKGRVNAFQAGIKGCVFPGVDAAKWFESPTGAIIVVDEAWKWFAPAPPTKEAPPHMARLPEIRHEGRTLVLVTQHPNDLDARVRRRVGKHYHLVRVFGSERSNVHEWNHCHEDVDTRIETENFLWSYDKESFGLYKSAELHKIKVEVPRKLKRLPWILGIGGLAMAGGLWYTIGSLQEGISPAAKTATTQPKSGLLDALNLNKPGTAKPQIAQKATPMTAQEYVASLQPRIADLPHTAPAYDEITKPSVAPVIAACVKSASKGCHCWTQQATPLVVSAMVCEQFVKGGVFQSFNPGSLHTAQTGAQAGVVAANLQTPSVVASAAPAGPSVSVIGDSWNHERIARSFTGASSREEVRASSDGGRGLVPPVTQKANHGSVAPAGGSGPAS